MSHSSPQVPYRYSIYGVRVSSDCPFDFAAAGDLDRPVADVEFVRGTDQDFQASAVLREPAEMEFVCRPMPDGSTYLRWAQLYEFSVAADGARVRCRALDQGDHGVLQN